MALDTHCFDGTSAEWPCMAQVALHSDHCNEVAVVHVLDQEMYSGRTFPLCFRHAFDYALCHDEEAQQQARQYAINDEDDRQEAQR